MAKNYQDLTLMSEINKKINTFNKTRINRIKMSQRLKEYNERWRVVFFFLNIEAVIYVILSLAGESINGIAPSTTFNVISGIYAIYVTLIQYYVNQLNYSERALKVHYHQLDIEDLVLQLKSLVLEVNSGAAKKDPLDQFNMIMTEYQRVLKNNENHDPIDNKKREEEEMKETSRTTNKRKLRDFSPDNIVLTINTFLLFIVPVIVYFFY